MGTAATVRLIEGVRLIRCPLNTGFTVLHYNVFFKVAYATNENQQILLHPLPSQIKECQKIMNPTSLHGNRSCIVWFFCFQPKNYPYPGDGIQDMTNPF